MPITALLGFHLWEERMLMDSDFIDFYCDLMGECESVECFDCIVIVGRVIIV